MIMKLETLNNLCFKSYFINNTIQRKLITQAIAFLILLPSVLFFKETEYFVKIIQNWRNLYYNKTNKIFK